MDRYYLSLDTYLVTQSDYFRLATTVTLYMGVTHSNLLLYSVVSVQRHGQGNYNAKVHL